MNYQLKITLMDVSPRVWRRVVVPAELTLLNLHYVIQIVMGWENYHLHDFTIKRQRYALPSVEDVDDPVDESMTILRKVISPRDTFLYQYDFGDGWAHTVLVEKTVEDNGPTPSCVAGERACPPEDSGGPWGYKEKLEALAHPNEGNREIRDWLGLDFDSAAFDMDFVNKELRRFFRPRHEKRRKSGH